mmetsp:Transcript_55583/g.118371  ORF Transcript_55583/g.118371 Transcript_55583/m.118371 type:complete len:237 (+) Transcript_55583:568-1278(+)
MTSAKSFRTATAWVESSPSAFRSSSVGKLYMSVVSIDEVRNKRDIGVDPVHENDEEVGCVPPTVRVVAALAALAVPAVAAEKGVGVDVGDCAGVGDGAGMSGIGVAAGVDDGGGDGEHDGDAEGDFGVEIGSSGKAACCAAEVVGVEMLAGDGIEDCAGCSSTAPCTAWTVEVEAGVSGSLQPGMGSSPSDIGDCSSFFVSSISLAENLCCISFNISKSTPPSFPFNWFTEPKSCL